MSFVILIFTNVFTVPISCENHERTVLHILIEQMQYKFTIEEILYYCRWGFRSQPWVLGEEWHSRGCGGKDHSFYDIDYRPMKI